MGIFHSITRETFKYPRNSCSYYHVAIQKEFLIGRTMIVDPILYNCTCHFCLQNPRKTVHPGVKKFMPRVQITRLLLYRTRSNVAAGQRMSWPFVFAVCTLFMYSIRTKACLLKPQIEFKEQTDGDRRLVRLSGEAGTDLTISGIGSTDRLPTISNMPV